MGNFNGMYVIESGDVVSGKLATAFIKQGGKNIPCSWFTSFSARMDKKKKETPRLGSTSLMQRTAGWTGNGSCRMYYATTYFRKLAREYAQTGRETMVDIVVSNEDPSTTLGAQAVLFKNVTFDSIPLAKFDVEGDAPLTEELPFTFDDFEIMSSFTHPAITE